MLPTGLGKTLLSLFDYEKVGGKLLYIVHTNNILTQTKGI